MRKTDGCVMEKFGTSDGSEKTIAIVLGNRWWPQAGKEEEIRQAKHVCCKNKNTLQIDVRSKVLSKLVIYGRNVLSTKSCKCLY